MSATRNSPRSIAGPRSLSAVVKLDERTPEEVIRSIEDQGKIVAEALSALRKLIKNGQAIAN